VTSGFSPDMAHSKVLDLSQLRVAIIAEQDPIYCLSLWEANLPKLLECSASVAAILLCPPRFADLPPEAVGPWYQDRFGSPAVRAMALFARIALATRERIATETGIGSFGDLARRYDIGLHACDGPNDPAVAEWLRSEAIDVLVVNCGHIIRQPCLDALRLGAVNLHESLLPAHAGVFPYLHTLVAGDEPGLTAHIVDRGIDTGPILAQRTLPHPPERSLVGFQQVVADTYPDLLIEGLAALQDGRTITPPPDRPPSYHGLPTNEDVARFEAAGGAMVTARDILAARQRVGRPRSVAPGA